MVTVDVTAFADGDLKHSSYVLTGLRELEAQGMVRLRFGRAPVRAPKRGDRFTSTYEVRGPGLERPALIAVDFHDSSISFDMAKLEKADLYFKRNCRRELTERQVGELANRVRPAGLSFAVGTEREPPLWFRYQSVARSVRAKSRSSPEALSGLGLGLRRVWRLRRLEEFERGVGQPIEPVVLFQARVYPHTNQDLAEMSDNRAAIVRALRDEFGPAFVGGIMPTEDGRALYPDCLTSAPSDPRGYTGLVSRAAVAVCSRGMKHSSAWKIGEFMAAGRCIVAEELVTDMPRPVEDGTHALMFRTVDECVAQCRRAFDDPELAAHLRRGASEFYRSEVRPDARVRHMLEAAREILPRTAPAADGKRWLRDSSPGGRRP